MEPTTIFNLLPEIWEFHIIPHMSPTDFHSIINSCPAWREMLKKKLAGRLLPLVLPILLKHKSVTPESLLVWRGVSRGAKSVVDGILVQSSSPRAYFNSLTTVGAQWSPSVIDEDYYLRNVVEKVNQKYDLRRTKTLRNFIAYQSQAGAAIASNDLFLKKHVQVCIVERLIMGYHGLATDFLGRYGHTISTVTFDVLNGSTSLILRFLSYVPNVKIFCLKGVHARGEEVAQVPQQDTQLNQLELLDVSEFGDNNHSLPLYSHLLRFYCSKITTLICNGVLFEENENVSAVFNSDTLPNLRYLRVKVDPSYNTPQTFLSALPNLGSLPLQEIQIVQGPRNRFLSIWDIVQIMDTFEETLINFKLFLVPTSCSQREILDANDRPVVPMSKLTKFSTNWSTIRHPWFWTMIRMKCQLLEELDIYGRAYASKYEYNEIQQKLFGSMPTLRKITVHSGFGEEGDTRTPKRIVITSDGKERRFQFSYKKD